MNLDELFGSGEEFLLSPEWENDHTDKNSCWSLECSQCPFEYNRHACAIVSIRGMSLEDSL